jgi:hypothetical protein
VVEDVEVGLLSGDTVVVDQWRPWLSCQRQWPDWSEPLRRCADATGIDIARTTDTAVITTIAVRSLRLILTLCSTAGFPPRRNPQGRAGRDGTRRADTTPRSTESGPALGSNHPDGRGPNVLDHGMNRVNAM